MWPSRPTRWQRHIEGRKTDAASGARSAYKDSAAQPPQAHTYRPKGRTLSFRRCARRSDRSKHRSARMSLGKDEIVPSNKRRSETRCLKVPGSRRRGREWHGGRPRHSAEQQTEVRDSMSQGARVASTWPGMARRKAAAAAAASLPEGMGPVISTSPAPNDDAPTTGRDILARWRALARTKPNR
jgi:hypothetical protein